MWDYLINRFKKMSYIYNMDNNIQNIKNIENIKNIRKKANQKYYCKKKEEILEKLREKVHCDVCECMINKSGVWKHQFTKKHIKNLEKKNFSNIVTF